MSKKTKLGAKQWVESPKVSSVPCYSTKNQGTSYEKGRTKEGGEVRRISPQEIQYRRNNHLCYKCGDKYTVGFGSLNFLVLMRKNSLKMLWGNKRS